MPHTAWIGLGSNRGDRQGMIMAAADALRRCPEISRVQLSSLHETEPVGGPPGQGRFLNAAARVETTLEPRPFFRLLGQIEHDLGRERTERWGPRTIDLDLLLFDDHIIAEADLTVPHPRMHERLFVLVPLAEIAADVVYPLNHRTIRELLADLSDGHSAPIIWKDCAPFDFGTNRRASMEPPIRSDGEAR